MWRASDLLLPVHGRSSPTDDDVQSMIDELHDEWVPDEESAPDPPDLLAWLATKFGIDWSAFTFEGLNVEFKSRCAQVSALNGFVVASTSLYDDDIVRDKLIRVASCIRSAYDSILHSSLLYHHIDVGREMRIPLECQIETLMNMDMAVLTSFQRLYIYFVKQVQVAEYQRVGSELWKQIFSEDGYPTHAWERVCTVHQFLTKLVSPETNHEQWRNMTNPRDNRDCCVKHFIDSFPEQEVDRYKWSYRNAIYLVDTDTAWRYDERDLWDQQAHALQAYRRQNGWEVEYTVKPPSADKMSVKYMTNEFRFVITPETEACFDVKAIPLVALEKLFTPQKLTKETQECVIMMMGRLFFKLGWDKWQVFLFFLGTANSGKSTIAKFIRHFYPANFLGTIPNDIEKQFGISAFYSKLLCICSEVKQNFGLSQAAFQSMASGEEISIAIKGQTAFQHLWDSPFLLIGNELPGYKNAAGSVDRRIFSIEFPYTIRKRDADPFLFEKILSDIDLFHRKAVRLYLDMIRKHGDKDIWCDSPCIVSQQIMEFKDSMRNTIDCLYNFISDACRFDHDTSNSMPLSDFKELYQAFRRENNEDRVRWNKDHFRTTFNEFGLKIKKGVVDLGNGNAKQAEIITGICLRDDQVDMS